MYGECIQYGISGVNYKLFSTYLKGRSHCVKLKGQISGNLNMPSGVPQGSVLGPVLFLIYVNDFPCSRNLGSTFLFADDAKIIINPLLSQIEINNQLSNISGWCTEIGRASCRERVFALV